MILSICPSGVTAQCIFLEKEYPHEFNKQAADILYSVETKLNIKQPLNKHPQANPHWAWRKFIYLKSFKVQSESSLKRIMKWILSAAWVVGKLIRTLKLFLETKS
mgnify:FL=1